MNIIKRKMKSGPWLFCSKRNHQHTFESHRVTALKFMFWQMYQRSQRSSVARLRSGILRPAVKVGRSKNLQVDDRRSEHVIKREDATCFVSY